ncbi:hypothetical protein N7493_009376 [Penicillium malachiteum]|uniref:Uncharacterized protein n=1 Tax=Penicillium malachiteum TaxID=1324776 RepID=A0AAD6HF31_9EURO|nr:hypothetical protein N7493_009376 [Penicillium malachiteum]
MPDPTSKQATEINRPWSGPGLGSGAHTPRLPPGAPTGRTRPAPSLPPQGPRAARAAARQVGPANWHAPSPVWGSAPSGRGAAMAHHPAREPAGAGRPPRVPASRPPPARAGPGTRRDAAEPCLSLRRHVASGGPRCEGVVRPPAPGQTSGPISPHYIPSDPTWGSFAQTYVQVPPTRHGRGCLTDLVKMDRVGQPTGHRTLLVTLSELVPSRDRPPPPTGHAHTPAD